MKDSHVKRERNAKSMDDEFTLFPRERHCQAPQEPEPTKALSHDDTSWSFLFSRYTLDGEVWSNLHSDIY